MWRHHQHFFFKERNFIFQSVIQSGSFVFACQMEILICGIILMTIFFSAAVLNNAPHDEEEDNQVISSRTNAATQIVTKEDDDDNKIVANSQLKTNGLHQQQPIPKPRINVKKSNQQERFDMANVEEETPGFHLDAIMKIRDESSTEDVEEVKQKSVLLFDSLEESKNGHKEEPKIIIDQTGEWLVEPEEKKQFLKDLKECPSPLPKQDSSDEDDTISGTQNHGFAVNNHVEMEEFQEVELTPVNKSNGDEWEPQIPIKGS